MNTYQVASNDSFITGLLDLMPNVSMEFRLWTLLIIAGNTFLTYLYEKVIVWHVSIWARNRIERKIK